MLTIQASTPSVWTIELHLLYIQTKGVSMIFEDIDNEKFIEFYKSPNTYACFLIA